jgi:AGZA family xanthine/uracil permease-like MFS transporter
VADVNDPELAGSRRRGRYEWLRGGDLNAFFGLMIDNISGMILMTSLLVSFGVPRDFILGWMIPGTAVGVLVGDLIFTVMAFRLAKRTRRRDVTAMPLGLDTPSIFGTVILIMGPAFLAAKARGQAVEAAAEHAWFLGMTMLLASGIFKLGCAPFSGRIRELVPRAGLLGSLAAIALAIISFLPLLDIASQPIAGLVSLGVILATLTARWRLPYHIPGALAAVVVGCVVYYGMYAVGLGPGPGSEGGTPAALLRLALPAPLVAWGTWFSASWPEALAYLPVAIPLALATVVGGIDCTESAAAAGDDYPTGQIIAAEGVATLVGGLFGGVIQTTPYIGHPAYKAMGARAGYAMATAVFVGAAGVLGYFDWIFYLIPKAVIFPILIFIGLEITAQSFHATSARHYPAVALACVPALAYLALITIKTILPEVTRPFAEMSPQAQHWIATVTILAGGFILTSLLWGTFLTHLIDGRVRAAAWALVTCGVFAWFGIIHSPLPSSPIGAPWDVVRKLKEEGRAKAAKYQTPYHWSASYAGMAILLLVLGRFGKRPTIDEIEAPKPI